MANIAHPKMPAIMFHTKKHAQKKQNQKQKIKKNTMKPKLINNEKQQSFNLTKMLSSLSYLYVVFNGFWVYHITYLACISNGT